MSFLYELDKSSKKYTCPKCGKKRMVCFIDKETNQRMPLNFGKCDRGKKCGYFSYPKANKIYIKPTKYIYTPPKPVSYHDYNLLSQSCRNYKGNNFIQFLKTIFEEEQVKEVIKKYCIGTSKLWNNKGACVFWQIDNQEKIRHGKIMLYDAKTGKRSKDKNGKPYIHSVKSLLKLDNFNLKQCLFGLHLINESTSKTIGLVEGEKTAIIMSVFKPEYLWLSAGSVSGLKYDYLKPIKDYKVIAFPDKGEYNDWLNKSIDLNNVGFDISVSDYIENLSCKEGTDLADIYLEQRKSFKPTKLSAVPSQVDNINEVEIIQSNTEYLVSRLSKENPILIDLIREFDLTDENGLSIRIV